MSHFSIEDAIKIKTYFKIEKSEEEILIDVNHLNEEQREILKRFIINEITLKVASKSEKARLEYIKKILIQDRDYKSFFSFFKGSSKESVISCLNLIEDKYKQIVYKKFGLDLSGKSGIKISENEEYIIYYNVNRRVKRMLDKLNNGYIIIGLSDIYKEIDIKKYVDYLPEKTKEYFYIKFGENLDKKYLVKGTDSLMLKTYKIMLDELIAHGGKKITPFYSFFKNYKLESETEEEFKSRIKHEADSLDIFCKTILIKAYGEDYDSLYNRGVTSSEVHIILRRIVPKIRYRLNGKDKNKMATRKNYAPLFYDVFPPIFTKFEIALEYSLLKDVHKDYLMLKFGKNFDIVNSALDEVSARVIKSIIKHMTNNMYKRKSVYYGVRINTLKEMNLIFKSEEYKYLKNKINSYIAFSVLCYLNIKDIDLLDIIHICGVNPKDYLEETSSILNEQSKLVKKC